MWSLWFCMSHWPLCSFNADFITRSTSLLQNQSYYRHTEESKGLFFLVIHNIFTILKTLWIKVLMRSVSDNMLHCYVQWAIFGKTKINLSFMLNMCYFGQTQNKIKFGQHILVEILQTKFCQVPLLVLVMKHARRWTWPHYYTLILYISCK
jgi:hypothetical protein